MSVAHQFRDGVKVRLNSLFQNTAFRYLFGIAAVASVFGLRTWLIPLTGTGAPFVLFFAAVLATSLFAGVGPAICAVLLSMPLGAYIFVVGAGYSIVQASFQSLLFAVDGIVAIYLTFLTRKVARSLQNANGKVRESEERYRTLFDSIDQGFCVVEVLFDDMDNALDYRILEVNRAFEQQTGIANAAGRWIREILPANEEYWFQIYGQIALTGEPRRFENPTNALGRFFDVYAFRVGRPEQRHVAILFNDITERKQVEEALRASEERFELAMEAGGIGTFDWNIRTNAVVWTEPRRSEPSRGVYEDWAKRVRPEDLLACEAGIREAFRKQHHRWQAEYRMMSSDTAEERWFHAQSHIFYDAHGEPLRMVGVNIDITERKRIERTLQESEAKFSGIVSISTDAIISIDEEQRITIFNEGAERIFGYSKAEAIGTPLGNLIPERFRDIHRQHVERFASGAATARRVGGRLTTITGLRKNGDEFPGEGAISKLEVGDKTILTVALRDITERKRVEQELKDANAFLDAIIENIPLMLFIKESQSLQFVRLNRAAEDLLGWPRQTLTGKSDYDFWPQAQAEFFVTKDRETLKRGTVVDISEEPIQTRHQGVRILHTKKVPILDTAGNPIYLLGISEDITERSRIEKEQRFLTEASVVLSASLDHEQTLATVARLAVQNVADWCVVDMIEEQGHLRRLKVASSDPAKAALCVALEQMPPDRDLPHLMRSVIESKRPIVVEHVTSQYLDSLGQRPGHLQALLATGVTSFVAVPLLMRGQPLGALFLGSSTVSRVFGHADLRLAEALADRAAMAIENARHYRSSVNATELRDRVLGIVVHDLRNPLTTILMQTSALKRQGPKLERRSEKPMEVIHRSATRMNRLIQDLLDVAVMEAGQLAIKRARLSAAGLIAEVVDMQRPLASSSSLEIRVEVDPDVAEVWGDRNRLLQVFENLIGNAIKFTPAGGRITAGATSRDDEVLFWVADTGRGIASENLPRVFDRFWQATKTGRQGAGLGLPITKGIVEAHGGRIWVESTAGSGSTFFFTIPRVSAAEKRLSDHHRRDRVA